MRPFRAVALVILCAAGIAAAQVGDSLKTADSLHVAAQQMPLWSDSTFAHSDSLGGGKRTVDRWLIPLGVIVLTGTAVWLLFSTRSR
ncbi:MAG TPA: hypothetical protein VGL38_05385 [bacterium]|jgi:hypothetical protein